MGIVRSEIGENVRKFQVGTGAEFRPQIRPQRNTVIRDSPDSNPCFLYIDMCGRESERTPYDIEKCELGARCFVPAGVAINMIKVCLPFTTLLCRFIVQEPMIQSFDDFTKNHN
jgi:hypothetical protein